MNDLSSSLKKAMRNVPTTVALLTSRDTEGNPHGMAASAVISLSVDPPSVLIAVNHSAGLYPVVKATGQVCINFLGQHQEHLIESFSRSDLRDQRFAFDDWKDAHTTCLQHLPWLPSSQAVLFGQVDQAIPYGTHTAFIVRVTDVVIPSGQRKDLTPLVWLGGRCAALA